MIPLIGLLIGLLIGVFAPYTIPVEYAVYVVVGILAVIDSIFGAFVANKKGNFDLAGFLFGLAGNLLLALCLTYMGDKFGVQLYLAPVFAFGVRLFQNFTLWQTAVLETYRQKKKTDKVE